MLAMVHYGDDDGGGVVHVGCDIKDMPYAIFAMTLIQIKCASQI